MHTLSNTTIHDSHHLEQAMRRPAGQPLITVSNHVAALDDPLVTSALLPPSAFLFPSNVRWTLCATDRCFKNAWMARFFRAGQVLPVERGAGLDQAGILAAEDLLRGGSWVHIFPEGTRSRNGRLQACRKGVGRLVASCSVPPLVVPFVHKGMDTVMAKCVVLSTMPMRTLPHDQGVQGASPWAGGGGGGRCPSARGGLARGGSGTAVE